MFKLASWNVNSLKVRLLQVLTWLESSKVDVLALQETKILDEHFPVDAFTERGYQVVYSGQKKYNGVAIISKLPLTNIMKDFPLFDNQERRLLAVTVAGIRLINVYVPNGAELTSPKYVYKLDWLNKLHAFLSEHLKEHPKMALVGDFNIAPEDIDVHSPIEWEACVLVSKEEREAFRRILSLGFLDSFRAFSKADKCFTWWDYRAASFRRDRGLRIDHILLSHELKSLSQSNIDKEPRKAQRPSDHAPIWTEIEWFD